MKWLDDYSDEELLEQLELTRELLAEGVYGTRGSDYDFQVEKIVELKTRLEERGVKASDKFTHENFVPTVEISNESVL